jgi:hypothetical protein
MNLKFLNNIKLKQNVIITSAAIQCGMPQHIHLASHATALIVIPQGCPSCSDHHSQLKYFPVQGPQESKKYILCALLE